MKNCNCKNKAKYPLHRDKGITETSFKSRWYNHVNIFRNPKYRSSTEFSKLVWVLKENNIQYRIYWKILKERRSNQIRSRSCDLCLTEKLHIMNDPKRNNTKKKSCPNADTNKNS